MNIFKRMYRNLFPLNVEVGDYIKFKVISVDGSKFWFLAGKVLFIRNDGCKVEWGYKKESFVEMDNVIRVVKKGKPQY